MLARRLLLSKAFRPSFFLRLQSSSTPPSTESAAAAAESKPEEIDFSNFDEFIEDVTSKTQDDVSYFLLLFLHLKYPLLFLECFICKTFKTIKICTIG